jgi:hypothetical protein
VKLRVLAALGALAVAQPAAAAIITVTVTGTVHDGFDQSGMFGAANTDLAGAIFSVVEYFDTTKGQLVLGGSGGTSDALAGGFAFNGLPSPGSATVTINGMSALVSGNAIGLLQSRTVGTKGFSTVTQVDIGDHVTTENGLGLQLSPGTPLHFLNGWHSDCPVADDCRGSFYFTQYAYTTNPGVPSGGYIYQNLGTFELDTFDVSVSGAVPEPATWAMMIAGFGLVGWAMRRRELEIA